MYLSQADLKQLDDKKVLSLSSAQKDMLLCRLLSDLKEAHDRLNANAQTSSRPPSSDEPWQRAQTEDDESEEDQESLESAGVKAEETEGSLGDGQADDPLDEDTTASADDVKPKKKVGHQVGAPGHSRAVTLPVTETIIHRPEECIVCGQALEAEDFIASTGLYVLDVETEQSDGLRGLRLRHDKHLYGEICCDCGHVNQSEPGRCPKEWRWSVELTEWHLVGPMLMSLIVCLSQRLRLTRRSTQEFLRDWLGVEISTSTINQCIHEAGRAVEPIEEQLVEELQKATLVYVDETPWKESGQPLWLWVISTATLCLYFIGNRSQEILLNVFEKRFVGWLMSDGYTVYRRFQKRLRCWAHLLRKTKGLKQSLNREARAFGHASHDLLNDLIEAVYQAREGPPVDLVALYQARLDAFRLLCEQHHDCAHEKTRALAREFLNDWDAIWIVLAHPHLPLTNNEAERALRHWVITRRITYGTRTEQGSRAFALLASVIETCRKRKILPWPYLAQVIAERRKGNPAPPLPAASA